MTKRGGEIHRGKRMATEWKLPPPLQKNTEPLKDESMGKSLKTVEALTIKEDCRKEGN